MRSTSTLSRRPICRFRVPCRACTCGIPTRASISRSSRPVGPSAATAERSTRSSAVDRAYLGALALVVGVGFLFDQGGAELEVHALLDRRPLVVFDVDRAGQADEVGVERSGALLVAY